MIQMPLVQSRSCFIQKKPVTLNNRFSSTQASSEKQASGTPVKSSGSLTHIKRWAFLALALMGVDFFNYGSEKFLLHETCGPTLERLQTCIPQIKEMYQEHYPFLTEPKIRALNSFLKDYKRYGVIDSAFIEELSKIKPHEKNARKFQYLLETLKK